MVQALDEAHAVDIVLAQHPDAHEKAVPAASIEGMNKHRLLFSWLESCKAQSPASRRGRASEPKPVGPCSPRARSPGRLTPRSAADCGPAAGPAHAAASGDRRRSALLHRETAAAPPCCLWRPDGKIKRIGQAGSTGMVAMAVWQARRDHRAPVLLRHLGRAAKGQPAQRLLLQPPKRAAFWPSAQRPDLHDRRAQLELIEAGPPAEGQELVVLQHHTVHPLTDAVPAPIN